MATPLPPTQPPLKEDYAGDEINALVLDPGSHTTRAGFAGEDTPKSVVSTYYGALDSGERLFGENAIHLPRGDMDIKNPFNAEGLVEDWDTASRLWEYSITSRLTGPGPQAKRGRENGKSDGDGDTAMTSEADLEKAEEREQEEGVLAEYPLLMSEPGWNPGKSREKMLEVAMEGWGVPAFFLAKNGQLAA